MTISIREVLELSPLNKARTLTGDKGLDRQIKAVTVMDAPDSVDWLEGNELLITSGYVIKDNILSLKKLIQDLAAVEAAGLGIKLRRFIDEIPREIITLARSLDFPIIEIPFQLPWIDIINSIHFEIYKRQSEMLLKSEKIYKEFGLSLLQKGGYEEICKVLYQLIDNPVMIISTEGKNYCYGWDEETSQLVELIKEKISTRKWIKQTINYSSEETQEKVKINFGDIEYEACLIPVFFEMEVIGYIVVIEKNSRLKKLDYIAIDQAAIMYALQSMINNNTREVTRRFKNHFVNDLISGNFESMTSLQKRAEFFGWELKDRYAVMVIDIDNFEKYHLKHLDKGEKYIQNKLEILTRTINTINQNNHFELITLEKSDSIVVLLPMETKGEEEENEEKVMEFAEKLKKRINLEMKDLTVSIGVGRLNHDISQLALNYEQASKALKYGRMVRGNSVVCHYDDLGVYRILCEFKEQKELRDYYRDTITRLEEYDQRNDSELVRTLEVFFEQDGNIKKTAEKMYVHYNTIRYRIERIQAITGMDLNNGHHKLDLQIGLKISRLFKNNDC